MGTETNVNQSQNMRHAVLFLLLAAFVWGFQPLCLKLIVRDINSLSINFYRYGIASITVFAILKIKKKSMRLPKDLWFSVFVLGVLNVALNSIFAFAGLKYSTAVNSSLFNAMTPAAVAVLAFVFYREKLFFLQTVGLIVSLMGAVWIVTGGDLSAVKTLSFNRGDIYFIFGQISWALYVIISSRVLKKISVLPMIAWSMFLGTAVIAVLGAGCGMLEVPRLSVFQYILFGYVIFIGGLLGMILWNLGVSKSSSSFASVFLYLIPVVGVLGSVFLLHEPLYFSQLFGGLAILFGICLITQYHHIKNFFSRLTVKRIAKNR